MSTSEPPELALEGLRVLIVDCQTTGASPSLGSVLELGFGLASAREPELELLAPVSLNVVCLRYCGRPDGPRIDDATLDAINQKIMVGLQEEGVAVPSQTILGGRFALRVAIVNHRSRLEDFDLLADEVLKRGRALLGA